MSFLDDLRACLRNDAWIAPAHFRRHVVKRLEHLEATGADTARLKGLLAYWSEHRVARFVDAFDSGSLADGATKDPADEAEDLIRVALDRALGLETSTGSVVRDAELDRLRIVAQSKLYDTDIPGYARRVRAVRESDGIVDITPIGTLILELPDNDAIRWLLALEVVQSTGDAELLSSDGAARLVRYEGSFELPYDDDDAWPVSPSVLERLVSLKLVEEMPTNLTHAVLARGRSWLAEVATGDDTPFTLLVRALLQDETTHTLGQIPTAAAVLAAREGTASIVTRQVRMVAHEIRNTLVPVQVTLESLYEDMDRRGVTDLLERRRPGIDGGIERLFRFVKQFADIADIAARPAELFDLDAAVRSAVAAMEHDMGGAIAYTSKGGLPPVWGHRDRFEMSIVNLLRNASQARATPVAIEVTTGTHNGAEVFVAVDDDGPGVPSDDRERIFQAGVSTRPGGSGQGLAFVRDIVTSEMSGKVSCEVSARGGARFVIRLPVGSKRRI